MSELASLLSCALYNGRCGMQTFARYLRRKSLVPPLSPAAPTLWPGQIIRVVCSAIPGMVVGVLPVGELAPHGPSPLSLLPRTPALLLMSVPPGRAGRSGYPTGFVSAMPALGHFVVQIAFASQIVLSSGRTCLPPRLYRLQSP